MLDVLVSHPSLDGSGVVAGVRQRITAAVAKDVGGGSATSLGKNVPVCLLSQPDAE